MIKAIFFDVGGVVITGGTWGNYTAEFCRIVGIDSGKFREYYEKKDKLLVQGKLQPRDFFVDVEKRFRVKGAERKWKQAWFLSNSLDKNVLEIAKSLRKKYIVALVSNVGPMSVRYREKMGLYKYFNPIFNSCEIGMSKPGKGIYQRALRKLGLRPQECVFIDDREGNLPIPRKMGFHTVHFKNAGQLRKDLGRLGLRF